MDGVLKANALERLKVDLGGGEHIYIYMYGRYLLQEDPTKTWFLESPLSWPYQNCVYVVFGGPSRGGSLFDSCQTRKVFKGLRHIRSLIGLCQTLKQVSGFGVHV